MSADYGQCDLFYAGGGIMEHLRTYILSVVAAALLCALSIRLMGKNAAGFAVVRMVCGVIMAAVILQPFGKLRMPNLSAYFSDLEKQVRSVVSMGTDKSLNEISSRIQHQTQAYLQNKAQELGAELQIQVTLNERFVPEAVILSGTISPGAKAILSEVITKDLGVGEEGQFWK